MKERKGFTAAQCCGLATLMTIGLTGVVRIAEAGFQKDERKRSNRFGSAMSAAAFPAGESSMIHGVPAPHQMRSIGENQSFPVPTDKIFAATGIVTTVNWTGSSPVVIRVDGIEVFKRPMVAGEVLELPPGICAGPGSIVEIDRLSASSDSRVLLLGYLGEQM